MYLGVKAVIAKSFERIHSSNLINFGILPLTFKTKKDYNHIDSGDKIQIKNIKNILNNNQSITVNNLTKQKQFKVEYKLTERQRKIILAGGMLSLLKN